MKKRILFLLLLITAFANMQAQDSFTIKGKLSNIQEPSKIMLQYQYNGERITDSTLVENGKFIFKGKIDHPLKATIVRKPLSDKGPMTFEKMMAQDDQEFYIESGEITVKGADKIETATIHGGHVQKDYLALQNQLKPLQVKMKPLSEKMGQYFKEKNEAGKEELFPKLRAIRLKMNKVEDAFILQHPDSYVSFDLVKDKAVVIDPETFEPFYNALSDRLLNTEEGKRMTERFAIAKRTAIGQQAMDFTQRNTKGEPVSLSSLRGKYILLDFWASWCGPCRAENPNVLKAYNKFKDQNFDVLAVSLDDNKEAWLKAIKEDGMPWIHVSDLLGWKNEVALKYGIRAIPQNFLIDPNGKIIASNLRGEKLEEALSKLIKN